MRSLNVSDTVPDELAEIARGAHRVVALSGAGVSAESGVPTFREVTTGLWERFSPEDLANPEAFEADPALVWTWYRWRQALVRQVEPNPGHRALADWQKLLRERGGELTVCTQNVDDLHERAGAEVLAHLHGSINAHRCTDCGEHADLLPPQHDGVTEPPEPEDPPVCAECGEGFLRPDIVWFGEALPAEQFEATSEAIRSADLVLVVGTSGMVQPAASLPLLALERGTPLVEVNPEETMLTETVDFALRGASGRMLPELFVEASR